MAVSTSVERLVTVTTLYILKVGTNGIHKSHQNGTNDHIRTTRIISREEESHTTYPNYILRYFF